MTNKNTLEINKAPKFGLFKGFLLKITHWGLIIFAFYFNYKFIDGNNFLDFMIFLIIIMVFIGYIYSLSKNITKYNDISDDKIKAIQELLSKD